MPNSKPLWRDIQRTNITSWKALAEFLELKPSRALKPRFPLNIPRRLAEKIEKGRTDDPLLRQFVPSEDEESSPPSFTPNPVGDQECRKAAKLIHKYHGRALLLVSSACAMHCRYCFRQHFPYETEKSGYEEELAYLQKDPTIKEIILSGGDPLSLSNNSLEHLIGKLGKIPHLTRLRFHTRFPLGIPERIDAQFLKILEMSRLKVWFVIHCNHPRELDHDVLAALSQVQKCGIPVLNQAVLLKGVNDSIEVLAALSERLADHGILPYYLHQLDRVTGASHFEVPEAHGLALVQELARRTSGYALPRYVRETPGEPSKTPLP